MEAFGLQSHDDTLEVAKLWSTDTESFVPDYLAFPSMDGGGQEKVAGGGGRCGFGCDGEEKQEKEEGR